MKVLVKGLSSLLNLRVLFLVCQSLCLLGGDDADLLTVGTDDADLGNADVLVQARFSLLCCDSLTLQNKKPAGFTGRRLGAPLARQARLNPLCLRERTPGAAPPSR